MWERVVCLLLLLGLFCSGFVLKLLRLKNVQGTQSQLQEHGVSTYQTVLKLKVQKTK